MNGMKKMELYCHLTSEAVKRVFGEYEIIIPKEIRITSLKEVLTELMDKEYNELLVKYQSSVTLTIKEGYRMGRLKWRHYLNETQLELEYDLIQSQILNTLYCKKLWESILEHIKEHPNYDNVINEIDKLLETTAPKNSFKVFDYNRSLDAIFFDKEFFLDGIHVNDFRKHTFETSNIAELKIIGKKYGVSIPSSLKKEELKERLVDGLIMKSSYTDNVKAVIEEASLRDIKVMLMENNLGNRSYLVKEEVVEYILGNAHQVKHIYQKPQKNFSYGIEGNMDNKIEKGTLGTRASHDQALEKEGQALVSLQLERIIKQQDKIIELLEVNFQSEKEYEKKTSLDKIYNYVIFTLIIIVALIWIVYGFTTLFG